MNALLNSVFLMFLYQMLANDFFCNGHKKAEATQILRRASAFEAFDERSGYSAFGASTGQTSAQEPHSVHFSGSMMYLPSPSDIASVGHSEAHAPQEMQSSLILYAIDFILLIFFSPYILTALSAKCNSFCKLFYSLKCLKLLAFDFNLRVLQNLNVVTVADLRGGFGT